MATRGGPVSQTFEQYLGVQDRRITLQERRPAPTSASDLLGPGMSSRAVEVMDWNREEATFNGFFWSRPGALNTPDAQFSWNGNVIAQDNGSGMQQVWNVDETLGTQYWVRTYVPNSVADGTVLFSAWKRAATASGFVDETVISPPIIENIDQALQDSADAMEFAQASNRVFRQPDEPADSEDYTLRPGDTWFDSDDDNRIYVWDGGAWVDSRDGQVAESAAAAAQAAADAAVALDTAEGAMNYALTKNTVFRQASMPVAGPGGEAEAFVIGDQWIDTDDGNRLYTWRTNQATGVNEWSDAQDEDIAAALAAAAQAQADAAAATGDAAAAMDFAEASNRVFRSVTEPASDASYTLRVGDTWFDSDDSNRIRVWDGSAWVESTPPTIIPDNSITATQIADNSISTPELAANAITSKHTITGALFQTTATASRGVKITSGGLWAYDAAGQSTLTIDAATGAVTMKGSLVAGSDVSGATVTGGTIQSEATAGRGVKINSAGLTAYDAEGNPTFTITAATGAVAMLGALTAGSTIDGAGITGSTVTGGTVQTEATADRGVKMLSSGLTGYDTAGQVKFNLSSTGALTLAGAITAGSTIDGAVVTGGTVQTESGVSRGIKINSTGLTAYDSGGTPTLTVQAATGTVTMKGALTSGSSVSSATITGGTIQSEAASWRGVKITSGGLYAYNTGGSLVTFINASNGTMSTSGSVYTGGSIDGAVVTGGTIQSESTWNRGIKMNSSGLTAYNSSGVATFTVSASSGTVTMRGNLTAGSIIEGAVYKSASSSDRVELGDTGTGDYAHEIRFFQGTAVTSMRNPSDAPGAMFFSLQRNSGSYSGQMSMYPTSDGHLLFGRGLPLTGGAKIKFLANNAGVQVRTGSDGGYAPIQASAFTVSSASRFKENIQDLLISDTRAVLGRSKLARWEWAEKHPEDPLDVRTGVGLLADDMPDWMRSGDGGFDLNAVLGFLWEAVRAIEARLPPAPNPPPRP